MENLDGIVEVAFGASVESRNFIQRQKKTDDAVAKFRDGILGIRRAFIEAGVPFTPAPALLKQTSGMAKLFVETGRVKDGFEILKLAGHDLDQDAVFIALGYDSKDDAYRKLGERAIYPFTEIHAGVLCADIAVHNLSRKLG